MEAEESRDELPEAPASENGVQQANWVRSSGRDPEAGRGRGPWARAEGARRAGLGAWKCLWREAHGGAGKSDWERVTLCLTDAKCGVKLCQSPTLLHPVLFPQLLYLTCGVSQG